MQPFVLEAPSSASLTGSGALRMGSGGVVWRARCFQSAAIWPAVFAAYEAGVAAQQRHLCLCAFPTLILTLNLTSRGGIGFKSLALRFRVTAILEKLNILSLLRHLKKCKPVCGVLAHMLSAPCVTDSCGNQLVKPADTISISTVSALHRLTLLYTHSSGRPNSNFQFQDVIQDPFSANCPKKKKGLDRSLNN